MNLKIGVTFHKPYRICDEIKNTDVYFYIHAGRQLSQTKDDLLLSFQGDNTGTNLSKQNAYINECTSLYWMYHNLPKTYDFYGHFQYHRFLQYDINDLNDKRIFASDGMLNPFYQLNVYYFFNFDKPYPNLFIRFVSQFVKNLSEYDKDLFLNFLINEHDWYRFNTFIMPKIVWQQFGQYLTNNINIVLPLIKETIQQVDDKRYYGYILQMMNGYFIYKKSKQGFDIKKCKTIVYQY